MGKTTTAERKNFTFRINEDLRKKMKKQSIDENRSVSDILNELIAEYLKSKGIKVEPL